MAFHLSKKRRFEEKEVSEFFFFIFIFIFNPKKVRFIAAEIVLALEHLHNCGIIYR
jgi:hypothetical protein